jgi:hypothetical protein
LDVGIATPALAVGGIVAVRSAVEGRNVAPGLAIVGFGLAFAAAGIYGYDLADSCLDAQNEMIYRNELEIQRQIDAVQR